ncbi:hypothetical protein [Spiroplasma culicicola]|uniref:DUF3137 domain-containing protein n=1 Tax=Spiroplasma culicicola AES-1 TaxID=1276246 RepID=W6A834_9MOLU|nr:hypothetical protein [Spiroplasma culicicola]AHI53050.1 hypothetical protein SCULI_v1c07090 [Spiroplasma culicicola AES-1]
MENTIKLVASDIRQNIDNPEFDATYKKYKLFNLLKYLSLVLLLVAIIMAVVSSIVLENLLFLQISLAVAGITVLTTLIFYWLARKASKKVALAVDGVDWNKIYQNAFSLYQKNNLTGGEFKKVEFKSLSRIKNVNSIFRLYEEPKYWLKQYDFLTDQYNENHIEMMYEDKYLFFKVNPTTECIVVRHYTDSKGKSQTTTTYYYVTTYNLSMENTKFDNSYNGVKVLPGKTNDKLFQTESIEFNKKFKINLNSTDLRAAKLLRPKMIEKMMNLDNKDFKGLGINNDFVIGKYNIDKGYTLKTLTNQIAVFDKMSKSSKHGPTYNFAKKVINDIGAIADCFQYLEGIY